MSQEYSPCRAADLVAAVFGVDSDQVRRNNGLPPKVAPRIWTCRGCGLETTVRSDLAYNGWLCAVCSAPVPIACDECGKVVLRRRIDVLAAAKRGAKSQFCGKRCQGLWLAAHHGFPAHPENRHPCRRRKHDYEAVWRKHLETGLGASGLGRLLGIPQGSVRIILATMRKGANDDGGRSHG